MGIHVLAAEVSTTRVVCYRKKGAKKSHLSAICSSEDLR